MSMFKVERIESDHSSILQEAITRFSNNEPDIFIVSKEGYKIYTQRSLLCLYSTWITSLLSSVPCCLSTSLSLPVSSNVINNLLQILHKGVSVTYEEKDLVSVIEAAELMGIKLGDYNIKSVPFPTPKMNIKISNKYGEEIKSDESNLLPVQVSDNETENVVEEIVEVLYEKTIYSKETLAEEDEQNDKELSSAGLMCEEVKNIGGDKGVGELSVAGEMTENMEIDNVQTLVEEVERMGANMETLAEELDKIDDDKVDVESNMTDWVNIEEEFIKTMPKAVSLQDNEPSKKMDTNNEKSLERQLSDKGLTGVMGEKQGVYFCDICSKCFRSPEVLQRHTEMSHGKTKCDICYKCFKRPQGLERHIEKFHNNEKKSHSNVINEQQIKSEQDQGNNMPTVNNEMPVPEPLDTVACKFCGKLFRSATSNYPLYLAKANLQKHMEKHETDNNLDKNTTSSKKYRVALRPKEDSLSENGEPASKLPKTAVTAVIPTTCSKGVKDSPKPKDFIIREGEKQRYEGEKQRYGCKQCSKLFSTREMLLIHQKTHAHAKEKFTCDKCGKCFITKDKLEKHMLFHESRTAEITESAHKCDICGKSFAKIDRLHLHRSYHSTFEQQNGKNVGSSNIKTFSNLIPKINDKIVCDKCGNEFDTTKSLQEHNLKFHPVIKQEMCSPVSAKTESKISIGSKDKTKKEICSPMSSKIESKISIGSIDKSNKNNQILGQLVIKKELDAQFFFNCEKCSEYFSSMEVLETHRLTSHETRECNGCDKTFDSEQKLLKHIDVHITENNGGNLQDTENMRSIQVQNNIIEQVKLLCCDICDMIFLSENILRKHNKAHTEEMLLTVRMPVVDITKNNVLFLSDFD